MLDYWMIVTREYVVEILRGRDTRAKRWVKLVDFHMVGRPVYYNIEIKKRIVFAVAKTDGS